MDFAFNEDQELLRQTTRRFLENRQSLQSVRQVLESDDVFDRSVWRSGAELGWTAMLIPEDYDGGSVTDQPLVDLAVLAQELGRVLYPGPFIPTNVVADALAASGSEAQRKDLLPLIAAGESVAAWCTTGDGSPYVRSVAVDATAVPDGYRLDGVARYVHGAGSADVLLVAAKSEEGLVHLLVPGHSVGVDVRRLVGLDLSRRLGEVRFEAVPVAASSVVGTAGAEGEAILARGLRLASVLQAAEAVGAAEYLFQATVQYAKDRVQFGRPIGSFQALKHRFADMHISMEAMRVAAQYAALAVADGQPDAEEAVAVAGSYVKEAFSAMCGEALQLHGGIGFTWEHDVHVFLRRAKTDQVLYGDPAWHRERLCQLIEAATAVENAK